MFLLWEFGKEGDLAVIIVRRVCVQVRMMGSDGSSTSFHLFYGKIRCITCGGGNSV